MSLRQVCLKICATYQENILRTTIDNLVVLAAVMDVPMDEIIVIDVKRTKQISA